MFRLFETVDSIVGEFNSIHKRLVRHSERKERKAERHNAAGQRRFEKAHHAKNAASRARNVAAKIAELVS